MLRLGETKHRRRARQRLYTDRPLAVAPAVAAAQADVAAVAERVTGQLTTLMARLRAWGYTQPGAVRIADRERLGGEFFFG